VGERAEEPRSVSTGGNRSEFTWPFAVALFALVILSILVMVGLGFALAWFAEKVA
jgi:hypothetical protein